MAEPLYTPTPERIASANITRFTAFCAERLGRTFPSYADLYQWSVDDIPAFWAAVWDFLEIRHSAPYETVVDDLTRFPGASWFPGARLNFAQNLLRYDDDRVAILFKGETRPATRLTYRELNQTVAQLARALRAAGVQPGDVVAGYLPNLPQTAMGMLATVAIGAVWTSCATDIGPQAAVDRLGQVEPKVLLCADGYLYKDKTFDAFRNATQVVAGIPSIQTVVVATYAGNDVDLSAPAAARAGRRPPGAHDAPLGRLPRRAVRQPPRLRPAPLRPPGRGHVQLGHHGQAQVPGAVRRRPAAEPAEGARPARRRAARRRPLLHHHGQLDDVELARLGSRHRRHHRPLRRQPRLPRPGCPVAVHRRRSRSPSSAPARATSTSSRPRGWNPPGTTTSRGCARSCRRARPSHPRASPTSTRQVKPGVHFNSISGGTDINGCFAIGTPTPARVRG